MGYSVEGEITVGKFKQILMVLLLCFPLGSLQAIYAAQQITLENSDLQVTLSPKNATLVSVRSTHGDVSYLGSSKQAGWFQIRIPLPDWDGHRGSSQRFKTVSVERQGPAAVEIRSQELPAPDKDYSVSTVLTLRLKGDNLVCRLSLKNNSPHTIDKISFPIVDVPPAADSKATILMPWMRWPLRYTFSQNDIRTAHNPFVTLDPMNIQTWFYSDPDMPIKAVDYPMNLPTAWVQYMADGKGIGFDVRDKTFQYKRFFFERRLFRNTRSRQANRHDYQLWWRWYPLVKPGESWSTSDVYIKFGGSDWHPLAMQHRKWLETWIRRPHVAPALKTSLGWISRGIRSYNEIPKLAKQGVYVGAPYFLIYGWSQIGSQGMTYGVHPRPSLGGLEALRRNLDKARALGAYPMAWSNETLSVQTGLGYQTMGRHWVAMDRWGSPLVGGRWSIEPFQVSTMEGNDVWIQNDPSTGDGQYLLETVRRLIDVYHFTGFEFDQGHKNFLSYRPGQAHPELAFSDGYGYFFSHAEKIVKKADPNGIIVGENLSELMNQYVDSSWIFEGGPPLNVRKFSVLRYSLPWVTVPTKALPRHPGQANLAFMLNAPLDIFDDLNKYPKYEDHLRRLHALKEEVWRYLYQGYFSDEEGFSLQTKNPEEVQAKSYISPQKKFEAVVVANASGNVQQATVRPNREFAAKVVHRYGLGVRMETEGPASEFHLTLPAYDVQVLVFGSQQGE